MSIHFLSSTSLLAGTESGHVICFAYQGPPEAVTDARLDMLSARHEPTSQLPKGRWVRKWKVKIHREAGECHIVGGLFSECVLIVFFLGRRDSDGFGDLPSERLCIVCLC